MQDFVKPITEAEFIGYDDTHPSHLLPPGYFVKANNVFVSDNKVTKVPGSTKIANAIASQSFNGFASFERISASTKLLVVNINGASNSQLYTWNGSGNFSAIGSANLTNSKQMWFEVANDQLWGFNGTEVVDYDGTTVTKNRAAVPIGFTAAWFHNYLFVANTTTYPNRLFWSNLGDPTTFSGTNFVDINPGDSDSIQALGKFNDELIVFKRNTIWSVTGFSGSSFSSTTIATQNTNARIFGYGCCSPFSIVPVGNDIYFFSMLGNTPHIRSLRLTSLAKVLGGGIITDDIVGTMDSINKSALNAICGGFDGRYAYWGIPTASSTVNNKLIVLDTWKISRQRGGNTIYPWTTMTGKNASYIASSTISGSGSTVFFTDSGATGKVFKFDTSVHADDGSNIAIDVITRNYVYDLSRKMKWKYDYIRHETGVASTLNVYARVDNASDYMLQQAISLAGNSPGLGPTGTFTLGVSTLGGNTTSTTRVTNAQLIGKLFQMEFTETSSNAVTINDWELYAQPKGLRNN